ncbi:hypothetical protein ACFDTO_04510 [Microbacteriaceae bacterium 4G12]
MGTLFYGAGRLEAQFDDRTLAHLQIVMAAKLRRSEGFMLSWSLDVRQGSGRSSVWIHPSTDLQFLYTGSRSPEINREWLAELADLSHGPGGLHVTGEGKIRPGQ